MCGEVLDRWGDHAFSCSCGGDKILRHNAIRYVVCSAVSEFTSVSPEVEKPGLLRGPDPGLGLPSGFQPPSAAGRHLADVWVSRGMSGFTEAWDFSVSFLLRTSHFSAASPTVADVFQEVEARRCAAERGATIVPLVLEGCGREGGGGERRVGPSPFERSWLGLPPSHALLAAFPLICLETPASGVSSASAAPFTGKTRAILRRSPGSVNGSTGLVDDPVPSSDW